MAVKVEFDAAKYYRATDDVDAGVHKSSLMSWCTTLWNTIVASLIPTTMTMNNNNNGNDDSIFFLLSTGIHRFWFFMFVLVSLVILIYVYTMVIPQHDHTNNGKSKKNGRGDDISKKTQ